MEFITSYRLMITLAVFLLLFLLESLFPFYQFKVNRWKHALRNLSIGAINSVTDLGLMLLFMTALMQWCVTRGFGIINWFSLSYVAGTFVTFIILDLWMYTWHRLIHVIPFMWRLHRVHHSDIAMDSSTIYRFHILEIIISFFLKSGVLLLLGADVLQIALYMVIMNIITFIHHSNVRLPSGLDRILRLVIVSPDHHRVHHSVQPGEFHSNYGAVFSFWDRIFASFVKGEQIDNIKLGLNILREEQWQTVIGMLKTPFKKKAED